MASLAHPLSISVEDDFGAIGTATNHDLTAAPAGMRRCLEWVARA